MSYTMNKADVYTFAAKIGAETKEKGDELFFKYCPYCHGGEGRDQNTMSVNLSTGAFKCFRSGCGKVGHFVQLARDFDFKLDFGDDDGQHTLKRDTKYKTFRKRTIETREPAIKYLESRGISEAVARRYQITTRTDDDTILVIPFIDENGNVQRIKYRKTNFRKGVDANKEWCEANTRPILFGMWQCEDFTTLVITEGQIDSLSLAEAGIKNAVSVPDGCKGFTWWDNCWEWVRRFDRVVVFGDHEHGKITLVDELSKRIPKLFVVKPEYYLGEKDANDILRKYGKNALIEAVDHADRQPVQRIVELADVEKVDISKLPRIETGVTEIDRVIGGMFYGQVILLSGKRGEGKSTFMSQLIAEALNQNQRVLAYSGELTAYHFRSWLDFQLAGTNVKILTNKFGDDYPVLEDSIADRIADWYRGRMFIYDNTAVLAGDENEELLQTIETAIQRYSLNMVCIDNLMTALDVNESDDLYRSQSKFVQQLKLLATKYNIVIVLVAHPKKSKDEFGNDDVSGSSDITNRVDVVMYYARAHSGGQYDSELTVTKNRLNGRLISKSESVKFVFNKFSRRIDSVMTGNLTKRYGWETMPEEPDPEQERWFGEWIGDAEGR